MSKKETLESDFFVLTALHEKYSSFMVAQVVHTVVRYGVDDLLANMTSNLSANDAITVR